MTKRVQTCTFTPFIIDTAYSSAEEFVNDRMLGGISYDSAFSFLDSLNDSEWSVIKPLMQTTVQNDIFTFDSAEQSLTRIRTWETVSLGQEWISLKDRLFPLSHPYLDNLQGDYSIDCSVVIDSSA